MVESLVLADTCPDTNVLLLYMVIELREFKENMHIYRQIAVCSNFGYFLRTVWCAVLF